MTSYRNGGFFNHAYHDTETLEIDRRASSKTHHTNPYDNKDPTWWGDRASNDAAIGRVPQGGWQEQSWRGRENIPMDAISIRPRSPPRHHGPNHSIFGMDPEYNQSRSIPLPSSSGKMTMRWRGIAMRRMSMFPNADHTQTAFTEDAIWNEMQNEQQNLLEELAALSTRDRIQAIRDLPMSFKEKKHIRKELELQSSKKSRQFTCLADCSEKLSLFSRKCGYHVKSAKQTLKLWQGAMKSIGGKFGTSVLTYFVFLKWLLMFNIFSFLVNFGFVTIPLLVYKQTPNISQIVNNVTQNVTFRGLEILTGAGYFKYTVMYYGSYSNQYLVGYNMQLAYFFTIAVYMVLCGISLIFSMAVNFKNNYVLADSASNSAWQLLCTWDFSVTNEKAVKQRRNNLCVQLKESLSETAQQERLTVSEKLKHYGIHFGCWLLSTSLAFGCAASIYYLCEYEIEQATENDNWSLLEEAKTLLVPFVVSLINLVIPLFYSLFNKFEHYSTHRKQIYALLIRNVFLKMSILSVLCYYWMNQVPAKGSGWESMVGQSLYRLVLFDFLFLMLGSFFGEFLSNVIGTKLIPRMGVPEFDVARNVLELIYSQTLAWIGIYFSPLLPAMQIFKFFILFYLKKVSLTHNCQPPRRSGRAAQMQTIFIFLLFFPFFVGALSIVAYTAWSLTPSKSCGPFRGLNNSFSAVDVWIDDLKNITGSQWVVEIYNNVIRSEIFYFLITLIILVIIYILWQVTNGRKELIRRLRQQIVNEGKDKSFLLERLQDLQKSIPNKNTKQKKQKGSMKQHSYDHSSGDQSNSNAMVQALLARQQLEEEEKRYSIGGVPVPSEMSNSSPLMQAMLARQLADQENEDQYPMHDENPSSSSTLAQAMAARNRVEDEDNNQYDIFNRSSTVTQAMQARRRAEDTEDDMGDLPHPVSNVMMQVMQARQQAQEDDRIQWMTAPPQNPGPSGSSALIQAMLARQAAQNEYDDGY
ncbi:transmembrane channel-like protein 5 isoform X1 [Simochromis diagramma]|uniref:transmembrane channel-like protein 5 isoform X1 n=1 Tax=Simochromis diagramma TaxID=43689 RepID=UPI001A7EE841|nr:transmembrane channel-like protein 5 isoform X1 [Simochromis diagramma]